MAKALVENWFEAFKQRDISLLQLAEDFNHSSPFGIIKGKQAYLDMISQNEEAFFSPSLEILDTFECGDKYAVRYLVNGNPACDCFYIKDGFISQIHSYYHFGQKPSF